MLQLPSRLGKSWVILLVLLLAILPLTSGCDAPTDAMQEAPPDPAIDDSGLTGASEPVEGL